MRLVALCCFVLLIGLSNTYSQKLSLNVFTTGFAASLSEVSTEKLSHFQNADYPNKSEILDLIHRDYTNRGDANILTSPPIYTGLNLSYYPRFLKTNAKVEGAFTLGYGVLSQLEEFSSSYYNHNEEYEIFRANQVITRNHLSIGSVWDYQLIQIERHKIGLLAGLQYNIDIAASTHISAKYLSNNSIKFELDNYKTTVASRSFFQSFLGFYTEYEVSSNINIRGSVSLNSMYFGNDVYSKSTEISPLINISCVIKP